MGQSIFIYQFETKEVKQKTYFDLIYFILHLVHVLDTEEHLQELPPS